MSHLDRFPAGTVQRDVALPDGIRLRTYRRGPIGAPTILFLHGFPELALSWKAQLAALGDDFHCVAVDMRGFGGSSKPRSRRAYALDVLRTDIERLIDELGGRAHLVGHDWGAIVAWDLAMHDRERIDTLTIFNCPPLGVVQREALRNRRQLRMSWYTLFYQLPIVPEWLMRRRASQVAVQAFRESATRKEAFTDDALEPYAAQFRDRAFGGANYYRANLVPLRDLRSVSAPTRVVWGMSDPFLGPWFADASCYSFVENLEVHRVERCGHWIQQEAPDEVVAHIRAHITSA